MNNITITPKGGTVTTLEEYKELELGTKLYSARDTNIVWWYYGGINPKSPKSVILISAGNVQEMRGEYIGEDPDITYLLDYEDAKRQLHTNAEKNVEKVKRIFTIENE